MDGGEVVHSRPAHLCKHVLANLNKMSKGQVRVLADKQPTPLLEAKVFFGFKAPLEPPIPAELGQRVSATIRGTGAVAS